MKILWCRGAPTWLWGEVNIQKNKKNRVGVGKATLDTILSLTAGPARVCNLRSSHTSLMNHTEYLLWVIYFPLSITSQAETQSEFQPNHNCFSTHHRWNPHQPRYSWLLEHPSFQRRRQRNTSALNNLSNYLPSLAQMGLKSWTPALYLINSLCRARGKQ